MKRSGYSPRLKYYPQYGSQQILLKNKQSGEWDQIIDIQSLHEHQSQKFDNIGQRSVNPNKDKSGYTIQNPRDQLNRKQNSVLDKEMPEHRQDKDRFDYLRVQTDLRESEKILANQALIKGDREGFVYHKKVRKSLGSPEKQAQASQIKIRNSSPQGIKSLDDQVGRSGVGLKQIQDPVPHATEQLYYQATREHPNQDIKVKGKKVYVNGKQYKRTLKNTTYDIAPKQDIKNYVRKGKRCETSRNSVRIPKSKRL